ncbi:hypothetical protein Glove_340g36 [Diversispora epigaea]|uniref:Uncharacterized protein n=1 Tax=Diversispora epigaea TaxID=1348612 RepID=A0A397HH87_9GLOM|nr:hypothetical protein Glove_340g36 [Diversispora epigaea]
MAIFSLSFFKPTTTTIRTFTPLTSFFKRSSICQNFLFKTLPLKNKEQIEEMRRLRTSNPAKYNLSVLSPSPIIAQFSPLPIERKNIFIVRWDGKRELLEQGELEDLCEESPKQQKAIIYARISNHQNDQAAEGFEIINSTMSNNSNSYSPKKKAAQKNKKRKYTMQEVTNEKEEKEPAGKTKKNKTLYNTKTERNFDGIARWTYNQVLSAIENEGVPQNKKAKCLNSENFQMGLGYT